MHAFKDSVGKLRSARALFALQHELALPPSQGPGALNNLKRAAKIFSRETGLDVVQSEDLLKSSLGELFPKLKRHFFPMKEAKEFLNWAKIRYRLILATDPLWPESLIKLRLEWAGISPEDFDLITHSELMHACKPTAEYYSEILEHAQLKPQNCLLIGNDMKMDLPAIQVNIPVYILSPDKKAAPIKTGHQQVFAYKGTYRALRKLLEHE